jgi:hypothetical protein
MVNQIADRRASHRFALAPMLSPVTVQRVRGGKMETLTGHAYDISESGMRIEVDGPVRAGERLNVSVALPGDAVNDSQRLVSAACEVVWTTDCEDDPVSPREGLRILRYLDSHSASRVREWCGDRWLRLAA